MLSELHAHCRWLMDAFTTNMHSVGLTLSMQADKLEMTGMFSATSHQNDVHRARTTSEVFLQQLIQVWTGWNLVEIIHDPVGYRLRVCLLMVE